MSLPLPSAMKIMKFRDDGARRSQLLRPSRPPEDSAVLASRITSSNSKFSISDRTRPAYQNPATAATPIVMPMISQKETKMRTSRLRMSAPGDQQVTDAALVLYGRLPAAA